MPTLANSEDPDEHSAAFFMVCTVCEDKIKLQITVIIQYTCGPLIYTMDHPKLIVSNQNEDYICT